MIAQEEGERQRDQALWIGIAEFDQRKQQEGGAEPCRILPEKIHCDAEHYISDAKFTVQRIGENAVQDVPAQAIQGWDAADEEMEYGLRYGDRTERGAAKADITLKQLHNADEDPNPKQSNKDIMVAIVCAAKVHDRDHYEVHGIQSEQVFFTAAGVAITLCHTEKEQRESKPSNQAEQDGGSVKIHTDVVDQHKRRSKELELEYCHTGTHFLSTESIPSRLDTVN